MHHSDVLFLSCDNGAFSAFADSVFSIKWDKDRLNSPLKYLALLATESRRFELLACNVEVELARLCSQGGTIRSPLNQSLLCAMVDTSERYVRSSCDLNVTIVRIFGMRRSQRRS